MQLVHLVIATGKRGRPRMRMTIAKRNLPQPGYYIQLCSTTLGRCRRVYRDDTTTPLPTITVHLE